MNRTTTSFPVADSPCRHVVVSVAATRIAFFRRSRQAGDCPTARPARLTLSISESTSFDQTLRALQSGRPW